MNSRGRGSGGDIEWILSSSQEYELNCGTIYGWKMNWLHRSKYTILVDVSLFHTTIHNFVFFCVESTLSLSLTLSLCVSSPYHTYYSTQPTLDELVWHFIECCVYGKSKCIKTKKKKSIDSKWDLSQLLRTQEFIHTFKHKEKKLIIDHFS